ncbi:MAG TPA: site-2 protease family protein [Pirellulales bacterium]|nr:site-2 protease family protein [Pirellulales bacterium]
MDFELIAGMSWFLEPGNWPIALAVAAGIGLVIFVHELGHFAVAKWCGVKCEKFYLGFDIGGWKLFKFQWGETEYGIGILPLGGYVKMLGQEDNPQQMREEFERSKIRSEAGEPVAKSEGDEPFVLDPRSFLAKSVPQRMAIISAGVIMNVIFCFVVSSMAYGLGVEQIACVVGGVMPGAAAWKSGNLLPGDEVIQVGSVKYPVWRDLQRNVMVGDDLDHGVPFTVRRAGTADPMVVKVVPDRTRGARFVGLSSGHTNTLAQPPVSAYSPLARLKNGFQPGDVVVAINHQQVKTFAELDRMLYEHPEAISVTVERKLPGDAGIPAEPAPVKTDEVTIEVPAVPMRSMGIAMTLGAVAAVQDGSPAAQADIRPGDRLKRIDGETPGDPLRLAEKLAARAGTKITLEIEREGATITKEIVPRDYFGGTPQLVGNDPLDIPALGVAIEVENQVAAVEPGGPADKAGLKKGDEIVKVVLVPPDAEVQERDGIKPPQEPAELPFDPRKNRNWLVMFEWLQSKQTGTKVELTRKDGRQVTIEPRPVDDWFNTDRHFRFEPVIVLQKAETVGQAMHLGLRETEYSLSLVYRILRKVFSGDVSIKSFGGPIEIARQAGGAASAGLSPFLIFLGMLSANLAVINFLPIPLLDGGHMVFLVLEGIRRKPASEKLVTWCQFAGLFFLLSLMAFVIMLDLGVIPRG